MDYLHHWEIVPSFSIHLHFLFIISILHILGLEMIASKFNVIVTSMKKKPYDYLDHRKQEFDVDYEEFKRQIGELHVSILH